MDRLQIAIQKARAQRAARLQRSGGAREADAAAVTDVQRPASLPPGSMLQEQSSTVPIQSSVDDDWAQIAPIDSTARQLHNNRLLSFEGGPDAQPYDLLRTRMLHQARANGWRRIGVVSPTPKCGKTTAVANLAFACSRQADLKTLVLDFDLRRPRLAKMLGQKPKHSMEDVLTGRVSFLEHAFRIGDNVAIGLNAGAARSPSELLQSRDVKERLNQIDADLAPDIILVDLPPMMATDDNFGFLGNVDAVLLMVAAEETSMSEVDVTIRQLEELTQVMGIVLNKCRYTHGAYGYDKRYY